MARSLRANSIVGPLPGWPAGGWGVRAGVAAMPGVRPGAGPNGSVWMRDGVEADRGQAGADLVHERRRPAQVCLGVAGRLELGEQRRGETACAVEVAAFEVVRAGTAVVDVGADVRERGEERAGLGGEGVVAAAACAVQPPDLPIGVLLRQRVEHGEDRGGADAGADQQDRRVGPVEDEGAARRGDVELVADGEPGVQIAAGGAVVLALDGDPVVAGVGRSGEGVVAEHRPLLARRAGSAA